MRPVPAGPFGVTVASRPGELVQIDTTPLDVMAVLDDGVVGRVELTIALDLATRSICAAMLRPHGTKAVDASLLLARTLVPEPDEAWLVAGAGDGALADPARPFAGAGHPAGAGGGQAAPLV